MFQEVTNYMTAWNIDGATCGDFNGNIISTIEGIADKQELDHTTNGKDMSMPMTKEEFKEVAKEVLNEI